MTPNFVSAVTPIVRDHISQSLKDDATSLSVLAHSCLAKTQRIEVVAGLDRPLERSADPSRSLLQVGAEWMVDPERARSLLARSIKAMMSKDRTLRVTSTQPALVPGDPFIASEPLFCVARGQVFATTVSRTTSEIERVAALSEGDPPGLIAVHRGPSEAPDHAVWFAISAFDGESYLVWQ